MLLPGDAEYPTRLVEGAIEYAAEHSELVLVDHTYLGAGGPALVGSRFDFDGALVWLKREDTWVHDLQAAGVVVVNTSGEWSSEDVPVVAFEGAGLVEAAAVYLAGLGRKQAAYIGCETEGSLAFRSRLELFSRRCGDLGMACCHHDLPRIEDMEDHLTRLSPDEARGLREFLLSLPNPAGVWCEEDHLARLVCREARAGGLSVPEDIAVLGIGDYRVARMGDPSLSTIPQPGQLVGRKALAVIHQLIIGGPQPPARVEIPPPPIVVRDSTEAVSQVDERFRQVHDWMARHACEGITVEEAVRLMSMSQRVFSKHFLKLFGRTPGAEIRHLRAQRARHYLRTTTFSVERIAELCGYNEPSKFSNFFKRETGSTPSAYRSGK